MISEIYQPSSVENHYALKNFGLNTDSLVDIGIRILAAYSQATPNDATTAAGTYAYLAAVRASRDILCHQGWVAFKKGCLEMVVPPSKQIAVVVSSGDKNTGLEGVDPKTKNPKGNQIRELIVKNRDQLSLFPELDPPQPIIDLDTTPTWFLLYHVDLIMSEMRMELSLPVNMDITDLRVDQWKKRIILSPVKFDPTPCDQKPEFAPDFDFEIRRKSNE